MSKVLENVNLISKMLQSDDTDLRAAVSLLKIAKTNLTELRKNFDSFVGESSSLAKSWNIRPEKKLRCRKAVKKFCDGVAFDSLFQDLSNVFKSQLLTHRSI
jgi:hypothetical protein